MIGLQTWFLAEILPYELIFITTKEFLEVEYLTGEIDVKMKHTFILKSKSTTETITITYMGLVPDDTVHKGTSPSVG